MCNYVVLFGISNYHWVKVWNGKEWSDNPLEAFMVPYDEGYKIRESHKHKFNQISMQEVQETPKTNGESNMKIDGYDVTVLSNQTVQVGCCLVTLQQAEQVVKMMKEFEHFEVGDYVKVHHCVTLMDGKFGKIAAANYINNTYLIEFAEPTTRSGSCDFLGKTYNAKHFLVYSGMLLEKVNT